MNSVTPSKSVVKRVSVVRDVVHDLLTMKRETVESAAQCEGTSRAVTIAVCEALADHVNWQWGDCYPAQWTLSADHGWCDKTIRRALNTLERLGLIEKLRDVEAEAIYGHDPRVKNRNRIAYRFVKWAQRRELPMRPSLTLARREGYELRRQRREQREDERRVRRIVRAQPVLAFSGAALTSVSRDRFKSDSATARTPSEQGKSHQAHAHASAVSDPQVARDAFKAVIKASAGAFPRKVPPDKPR